MRRKKPLAEDTNALLLPVVALHGPRAQRQAVADRGADRDHGSVLERCIRWSSIARSRCSKTTTAASCIQIPVLVISVTAVKAATQYFQTVLVQQVVLLVIRSLQGRMFEHLVNADLAHA